MLSSVKRCCIIIIITLFNNSSSTGSPNFILMVSLGRPGVKTFPILTAITKSVSCDQVEFYLGNIEREQLPMCCHLKGLVDYYKLVIQQGRRDVVVKGRQVCGVMLSGNYCG